MKIAETVDQLKQGKLSNGDKVDLSVSESLFWLFPGIKIFEPSMLL